MDQNHSRPRVSELGHDNFLQAEFQNTINGEHLMRTHSSQVAASETHAGAVEPVATTATHASIQSAVADSPAAPNARQVSEPINTNGCGDSSGNASHNGGSTSRSRLVDNPSKKYYGGWDALDSFLCKICFDAPLQAACLPCGHMACCMTCLKKIAAKNRVCPICRARIDSVTWVRFP